MSGYIKNILRDTHRKSIPNIILDLIRCGLKEKEVPLYYFTTLAYKKGRGHCLDYVGGKTHKKAMTVIHSKGNSTSPILQNKFLFNSHLNAIGANNPEVIAYNVRNNLFAKGRIFDISKPEDFKNSIAKILDNSVQKLFIKPLAGAGGKRCFKIDNLDNIDPDIFSTLIDSTFIFQQLIKQNSQVSKIYPHSVNTLRVHTVRQNGAIKVASSLMRLGQGGNVVDNASQGGIIVNIDRENGVLEKWGVNHLHSGGQSFTHHPDTEFKFEGFSIPYYEQVEEKCKQVAKYFNNWIIGWDIAITEDGFTFMEGNSNPNVRMMQLAEGGIKTNKVLKKLYRQYIK
ncbi:sugar-transfer associated ATP-grasp domain-containing protein [Proteinivorax hydrogeniformans]|uniref:Sugar-transfer associated ATP-grasp domain-containing protein n=1 Tax=Proteinivorax hydrogeniformans TaxID=1826727 RepID=A0AAU8HR45_9FIRM